MSLSLCVCSQSGPPKSVGSRGEGLGWGGGGGSGVLYHTSTGQYIGVATFFFFFFEPAVKFDEESIDNGLKRWNAFITSSAPNKEKISVIS